MISLYNSTLVLKLTKTMKKRKIYTFFLCDLKWYLYWRNTLEWIGGIHLQVCIFGLLKNCNDRGVSKSSHFLCRITLVSLPASRKLLTMHRACGIHAACTWPELSAQTSAMDRYNLPAAHKAHHFCKNFTKYTVPSLLKFGVETWFVMLHKCWWLFLVWNLKPLFNIVVDRFKKF